MPAVNKVSGARELLARIEPHEHEMVLLAQKLVEIESPTHNKKAVDALGRALGEEFSRMGAQITFHKQLKFGDHLQASFKSEDAHSPAILLLGHMDTVWELGALKSMPCRVSDGRVWGPGVLDMKAGIVQIVFALRALRDTFGHPPGNVEVLLVTDEEVGSESSRPVTEWLAEKSSIVFVLEPSQGLAGALKTARKGVGNYTVKVTGKAAHAGIDFRAGTSAITELAYQIGIIEKFTDLKRGLTVNPGVIRGGTRSNVVAAEAEVEVDVRIPRQADAGLIEKKFRSLRPRNRRCKLQVSGGINRPPMERSKEIAAWFMKARTLAQGMGWKLQEAATGGGSDGNFTAALGIPTLDGLGAVGEGAHAASESVLIRELPRRAALLAALMTSA
ncbi:MAG TPA: M20 family metallopeptidase [Terriglobales bacterium]|jgi:glutamate carboxypeptidase|nr:M20 family metallopeptidase [Terriglobales bacterium]